jgi:hypothetical protein
MLRTPMFPFSLPFPERKIVDIGKPVYMWTSKSNTPVFGELTIRSTLLGTYRARTVNSESSSSRVWVLASLKYQHCPWFVFIMSQLVSSICCRSAGCDEKISQILCQFFFGPNIREKILQGNVLYFGVLLHMYKMLNFRWFALLSDSSSVPWIMLYELMSIWFYHN